MIPTVLLTHMMSVSTTTARLFHSIASLRQLAPPVRLQNRAVSKVFNGARYLGKITHIRKDTDGELIYGVTYSDNDYEEYNFKEIMEILQAYNPLDDVDDILEITPFFGSSSKHPHANDTTRPPSPPTKRVKRMTPQDEKHTASKPTRKSSRVRVIRRPFNVKSDSSLEIPSSLNRHRLRYAMRAHTQISRRSITH